MSTAVRYQVMPPLSTDEYQELYESIKSEGVLEPIHVDDEGVVIDGHHRSKIASELGIPCPVITHDGLSESKKRSLAFTLNLKRRHLNREQRRALGLESLRLDPIASNREHSKRTGLSDKTIQDIREKENIPEPRKIIEEAVEENPEKSSREIARELGVGKDTVRRVKDGANSETPKMSQGETGNEEPEPSPPIISPEHLDQLNHPTEEEVRPKFQAPGEPDPEPKPERKQTIDREMEAKARAKSSAPGTGAEILAENSADRNEKRFKAIGIAKNASRLVNELAGILSDVGGIKGMETHLNDIQTALDVAFSANSSAGIDTELNNILKGN